MKLHTKQYTAAAAKICGMFTQKQNEIKLLYRVTQSDIFWGESNKFILVCI